MTEILFAVALLLINVVFILMARLIKRLYKEIDEIKENLHYLESCDRDNEHGIDQIYSTSKSGSIKIKK